MSLDGGRFLAKMFTMDANAGNFFKKIIDAINTVATNAAVATDGDTTPPPPISNVTVKASGEMIHATANHPGTLNRGIKYAWQVSANDPSFSQPHNFPSESRSFIHSFPTMDDNSVPVKYYVRCIPQYQGSQPAQPTTYGGGKPTAVTLSGSTSMTLLPSTGAGTADNSGQQGNFGLGKYQQRTQTSSGPQPG